MLAVDPAARACSVHIWSTRRWLNEKFVVDTEDGDEQPWYAQRTTSRRARAMLIMCHFPVAVQGSAQEPSTFKVATTSTTSNCIEHIKLKHIGRIFVSDRACSRCALATHR